MNQTNSYPPAAWNTSPDVQHVDLVDVLHWAWAQLGQPYGVSSDLPPMNLLFAGTDLDSPGQTAETVFVNMLTEIIECIGRFNPWYTRPAEAFGLISVRIGGQLPRWLLTPAAMDRWHSVLDVLALAIERNTVLLQVATFADELEPAFAPDITHVIAQCSCKPPRTIRVKRSLLYQSSIVCTTCEQPFYPAESHHA